jgi:hypothetical protein
MTRTPKLIASAFLVLTLATACGGGDDDGGGASTSESEGDRPSVEEFSASLIGEGTLLGPQVSKEQADCVAEAIHDSDVSDEALRALVAKDFEYQRSEADQKVLEDLAEGWMRECIEAETPAS